MKPQPAFWRKSATAEAQPTTNCMSTRHICVSGVVILIEVGGCGGSNGAALNFF